MLRMRCFLELPFQLSSDFLPGMIVNDVSSSETRAFSKASTVASDNLRSLAEHEAGFLKVNAI